MRAGEKLTRGGRLLLPRRARPWSRRRAWCRAAAPWCRLPAQREGEGRGLALRSHPSRKCGVALPLAAPGCRLCPATGVSSCCGDLVHAPPPHLQSQSLLSGGGLWLFSLLLPCLALGMLHVPCFLTVPSLPPFSGQHPSPWCFGTHCASISLPGHRSLGHQSWSPVLAPGGRRSLWQAHPGPRVPITVGCDR